MYGIGEDSDNLAVSSNEGAETGETGTDALGVFDAGEDDVYIGAQPNSQEEEGSSGEAAPEFEDVSDFVKEVGDLGFKDPREITKAWKETQAKIKELETKNALLEQTRIAQYQAPPPAPAAATPATPPVDPSEWLTKELMEKGPAAIIPLIQNPVRSEVDQAIARFRAETESKKIAEAYQSNAFDSFTAAENLLKLAPKEMLTKDVQKTFEEILGSDEAKALLNVITPDNYAKVSPDQANQYFTRHFTNFFYQALGRHAAMIHEKSVEAGRKEGKKVVYRAKSFAGIPAGGRGDITGAGGKGSGNTVKDYLNM